MPSMMDDGIVYGFLSFSLSLSMFVTYIIQDLH